MHRTLCFLLRDELARSIPHQATFRPRLRRKLTRYEQRLARSNGSYIDLTIEHHPTTRKPVSQAPCPCQIAAPLEIPINPTGNRVKSRYVACCRRSRRNVESENISLAISKSSQANFAYITSTLATSRVASFSRSNRRISILNTFENKVWRLKISFDRKSRKRFANRMQDIYDKGLTIYIYIANSRMLFINLCHV